MTVITLVALAFTRETKGISLRSIDEADARTLADEKVRVTA